MSPSAAPHADAIRALRIRVDRARRAAIDRARLGPVPPDADRHHPDALYAELVGELADRWADLPGPPTTAGALAAALAPLAQQATALHGELEALRHAQHEALHAPEHAELVTEITELTTALEGLTPDAQRAGAALRHLETVLEAVRGARDRIGRTPETSRTALATATATGLAELVDQVGLSDTIPAPGPGDDGVAWLVRAEDALTAALDDTRPVEAAVRARLTATQQRLDALLG